MEPPLHSVAAMKETSSRSSGGLFGVGLGAILGCGGLFALECWLRLYPPAPGVAPDGAGTVVAIDMAADVAARYAAIHDEGDPFLRTWVDATLTFAGNSAFSARLHARGHSSARGPRKSFTVDLQSRRTVLPGFQAGRLLLLNLAADPHAFEMSFCCAQLAERGLFPPFHRHVRVQVNGADLGLYLLMERPRDAIRRTHRGVVSVLRASYHDFDVEWAAADVDARAILLRLEQARLLAGAEERERALDEVLDVDAFLTWMAWNSLVQNRDSVDELFLFEVRAAGAPGRLGVMGWDYDDVQLPPARPANVSEDPLTWASESALEKAVLATPPLRERYRALLQRLLTTTWTPQALRGSLVALRRTLAIVTPRWDGRRYHAMVEFERALLLRRAELLQLAAR